MSNSTVNFTTSEASTNSTTHSFGLMESLEMCAFCISFLFGLPIHSKITWLIITGTANGVALEFFNLNLSISEICNSLNAMFGILARFFSSFIIVTHFLQGLGITGRPLFQCLICVERYLAVVHPVTFLKYKPLRYRVICCTAVWIIILGSCLFCTFILISFSMVPYVWFISVQCLLFFFTQLFCLVAVLRALKQSGPGERKREEENHMKRRAFDLILLTTVIMVIQYAPFTVTGFYVILTQNNFLDFWCPAFLCYVLAGFVQPILYLQRPQKLFCLCSSS
ncbi:C-C chemokine receptor type 8-like [Onychostoma macrolepis]|uniref:C-C chemokine receptor type 8-like n=1 Tax=Onychostoma macrolepis TaxID=369639 RepID=UPI00272C247A|nr:C-C chemokine receptor type 8-like [Onychostoma macrolepis]